MNGPLLTTAPEWYKSSDVSLIRPRIHTIPTSDTSTQRTQALALLKRRGMTRFAEFSEAGITATTVTLRQHWAISRKGRWSAWIVQVRTLLPAAPPCRSPAADLAFPRLGSVAQR